MDSSTQTSDGDIKLNSDLFNLAEKLQIELQKKHQELQAKDQELQKKDEELAKENQEKQVFNFYCLQLQICIKLINASAHRNY
jgi:Skp family chaperone for outer membrane proteins